MNEINTIICGNSIEVLKNYDDNFFDLTVFSPPYDNLRDYNGYDFDMNMLGRELFRVTKEGGIVVMVIQDQTIDGHKTLTSLKLLLIGVTILGLDYLNVIFTKNKEKMVLGLLKDLELTTNTYQFL